MSKAFFAVYDYCPRCERRELIPLGTSSIGWRFLLKANGFMFYNDWPGMKTWLKNFKIIDENDKQVEYEDFIFFVESKQGLLSHSFSNITSINGFTFIED